MFFSKMLEIHNALRATKQTGVNIEYWIACVGLIYGFKQ